RTGRHAGHAWGGAKSVFGDIASGHWGDALQHGKGLIGDVRGLVKDGTGLFAHGNKLFGKGAGLIGDAREIWSDLAGLFGHGKKALGDGKQLVHDAGQLIHGGGATADDASRAVQSALSSVAGFGKAVANAIKDVHALMAAGKTREAGDRVEAMTAISEQTRSEVTRAVSAAAKYPHLAKQAAEASKHYLEIRGHFFGFVKGLHGLAGQAKEMQGVDPQKYPDLAALMAELGSLQVKVDSLGDLKHSDTPMQAMAGSLKKEAATLRGRLQTARHKHATDEQAKAVLADVESKLGQIEKQLGLHEAKDRGRQGDKDMGSPPQQP